MTLFSITLSNSNSLEAGKTYGAKTPVKLTKKEAIPYPVPRWGAGIDSGVYAYNILIRFLVSNSRAKSLEVRAYAYAQFPKTAMTAWYPKSADIFSAVVYKNINTAEIMNPIPIVHLLPSHVSLSRPPAMGPATPTADTMQ